ncbi:chromosome partitioning protein [Deinococcus metalli]|uniref:Chromosome partitioning protein n=1 Tax=Deinococcus metalli TaxID=1141878 RepID=A0A7W8KAY8_9DEIO|nr:AAA family ATPase [Deinococcus metalli]MBB5374595.1 chromosome partitioning protein [Deinococcus metalli]GHF35145.1 chromosome partitioning protein ParA [Deinococcus metalli]
MSDVQVLSFINLKGGVAKTTTAVQLADTLAFMKQKRVLVLDLDPQTNATLALIGEERWAQADADRQTLAHLFLDQVNGTGDFDVSRAIIKGASNLNRVPERVIEQLPEGTRYGRVDVLPSSIRLIDVQDRMQDIAARSFYAVNPMDVVRKFVAPSFAAYDYVLIDCPPNLGFITQNGLEVSDHYVIPTIPDRLSTYGIPQIAGRIGEIRRARHLKLRCLGVVVTKYQSSSTQHRQGLERLPAELERAFAGTGDATPPIFGTVLPQTNASAEAMTFDRQAGTYRDKYGGTQVGGQAAYRYGLDLADELEDRLVPA